MKRKRPPPRVGPARRGGHAPARARQWLYGTHAVLAALANPRRRCHRLLLTPEAERALAPRIAELAKSRPDLPRPETAAREVLAGVLPPGVAHQGVALEAAPLPAPALDEICAAVDGRDEALVVVLDQVTDPRNLGAVLRSAAAFGAKAVVTTERRAPGEAGALAKAASGALERVALVRVVNLARALADLKRAGFWCAGLDAAAERTLAEAGLSGKVALVLGAEGAGLRRLTRERCDLLVRLPISPAVDSLNVSNAAAVALYELRRA